ncbi:hypothetical protein CIK58_08040 [Brevibacterium aurantiacum]|uniref:CDP-glycerol glycerophosphotransferase, TagB/SpsB family n=1 Tax=Brevibacterium aurantiacum TaxID=273384 RepID=A0A2A3YTD0_BREAU|nr:CDP-glycerol glycerophosphotransferase family protein [Brevibacterium aurantiacum]PCC42596.1 hypothetical protein CIK65_12800 [Brevibacterium aurantiacum]PCC57664.1 hypothetical protein CIK58_08040 [Brevibacterium aurantiacum]
MTQEKSLLHGALKSANLSSEVETQEFWEKSLGKGAKSTGVRQQYLDDSATTTVNKNVIFYESMSGARMGDNPYGIYEYLREHPEHGEFLHVWSIDAQGSIPAEYIDSPNVVFARRNTRSYTYFIASAGYVICNATLPAFFARRTDQKYLNTWHGIPYKALGRNTPKARFGSPGGNATFTKATHILTPGRFTTDKIISAYSMKGVSNATIAEIGYPRVDRTLNADADLKSRLREILGLNTDGDYRPTVLYAPTWRSEKDKDVVDSDQLVNDLKTMVRPDIQLLYRGHHRMDRLIKDASVGDQLSDVIIPPHEISSNDLLSVVDVLITDFSSIFFDFLPTGKPVIHYLYDLDEYARTRGINLSKDELPGAVAVTRQELASTIANVSEELIQYRPEHDFSAQPLQGDRYNSATERFCPHDDGHASKRAVEFLFEEEGAERFDTRSAHDERPTAAFWAGELTPGPLANSFLESLLSSAASPLEQTVLIIERQSPIDKDFMKRIKGFGDAISTFSYEAEQPVLLPDDRATYREFCTQYYLNFEAARALLAKNVTLRKIFAFEYRRRLDDAAFNRVFLAAGLSNSELALAHLATKGPVTTANHWRAPTPELRAPSAKVEAYLLPHGTRRRKLVAKMYRRLRSKFR